MASIGKLNVFIFLNLILSLSKIATPPHSLSLSFRKIFQFLMLKFEFDFRLVSERKTMPVFTQLFFKKESNRSFLFNALIDCTFKATMSFSIVVGLLVPWLDSYYQTFEPFDFEISTELPKVYRTFRQDSNRV